MFSLATTAHGYLADAMHFRRLYLSRPLDSHRGEFRDAYRASLALARRATSHATH